MQAAANQRNSIDYTLSSSIHGNPYHITLILKNLTQRLGRVLPEVVDEICLTFHSGSTIGKEWARMDEDLLSRCICATTNRVLVGLPLCRDPEYLDCLVELSEAVSQAGLIIDLVPRVFKPIIAYFLVHRSSAMKTFLSKLGPVFEERRKQLELGDDDKNTPVRAFSFSLLAALMMGVLRYTRMTPSNGSFKLLPQIPLCTNSASESSTSTSPQSTPHRWV